MTFGQWWIARTRAKPYPNDEEYKAATKLAMEAFKAGYNYQKEVAASPNTSQEDLSPDFKAGYRAGLEIFRGGKVS